MSNRIAGIALALCMAFVCLGMGVSVAYAVDEDTASSDSAAQDQTTTESSEQTQEESQNAASDQDKTQHTSVDDNEMNLVDPTQRADNSFIYDTSIGSLFNNGTLYDGQTVQVIGEVVGDRIASDADEGYCWISLESLDGDNSSSVSVLISDEQADQIDSYGRYGVTGTTLQVRGTFNEVCNEHSGLSDIHAVNADVVSAGKAHPDEFSWSDFGFDLFIVVIGVVLLVTFYIMRERTR